MSVPGPLRSESKLETHVKVEELVVHTVHICSNTKVFEPRYHAVTDRVIDVAVGIGQDIWEANGIRVQTESDWMRRKALQDRAISRIDVLLYLMTLSRKVFHLRSKKYEYWAELARTAKAYARKWRDSDVRRYGRLTRDAG